MADSNRKQAMIPQGGQILDNKAGTAPGIWISLDQQSVILLPGPPRELEPMFLEEVAPRLAALTSGPVIVSRVLRVVGLGESAMEEVITDLVSSQNNPTIAPLAQQTEVHLRLTAKADTQDEAARLLDGLDVKLRERLGLAVLERDEETIMKAVANQLIRKKMTLATAESCTGGLLSHMLTNVPGSSAYFLQGTVVYSNRAKMELLGIRPEMLREHGAVSEETARAMAESARRRASSDLAVAITGIAGPDGGTEEKPVGLVYIALAAPDHTDCRRFNFWGKRENIKEWAAVTALNMVRLYLARTEG
jgi:nicotinamide-nucleotide amidase